MKEIEFNENKVLEHSNSCKLEYIGKCLLINENGKKILVIGDLHLGYEEVLREKGVFIEVARLGEYKKYLDGVFDKIGKVDEIVLLGDVKHSFGSVLNQEWKDVLEIFDYFLGKTGKIVVVKGNHDRVLEPIVKKKKGVELLDYYISGSFAFLHGDCDFREIYDKKVKTWVVGHAHPAVKISDNVKVEKYKCFLAGNYKGKEVVIVPSFFDIKEGSDPRETDLSLAWNFNLNKFEVYIVSGLEVLDFGKLGKLR